LRQAQCCFARRSTSDARSKQCLRRLAAGAASKHGSDRRLLADVDHGSQSRPRHVVAILKADVRQRDTARAQRHASSNGVSVGRPLLRDAVAGTFPRLLSAEGIARSYDCRLGRRNRAAGRRPDNRSDRARRSLSRTPPAGAADVAASRSRRSASALIAGARHERSRERAAEADDRDCPIGTVL
jgi:hypothetical protein